MSLKSWVLGRVQQMGGLTSRADLPQREGRESREVRETPAVTPRRAIPMVGGVSRLALLIELSLPALKRRVEAGDTLQPAWNHFLDRLGRYGLPAHPRVRHLRAAGPLATLVIAYLN